MTSRRATGPVSAKERRATNRRGRPSRFAVRAVELAVLMIPSDARARWEQELVADLYGLNRRRQATYAVMTVATAWSLRASVTGTSTGGTMTIAKPRKPLTCLLNLHHRYTWQSTEDGGRFLTCLRCGKDKTLTGPPLPGSSGGGVISG